MSGQSQRRVQQHPTWARVQYKAVAVLGGRYFSIFDGETEYVIGKVRTLYTGIWVSPSIIAVVRHVKTLPRACKLLGEPRVVLRVLAWNRDGRPPLHRGDKLRVDCVIPTAVLPLDDPSLQHSRQDEIADDLTAIESHPDTLARTTASESQVQVAPPLTPSRPSSLTLPSRSSSGYLDGSGGFIRYDDGYGGRQLRVPRPRTAPAARAAPGTWQRDGQQQRRHDAGSSLRIFGPAGERERMQAQTLQLQEDLHDMEHRLEFVRRVNTAARSAAPRPWLQRALTAAAL